MFRTRIVFPALCALLTACATEPAPTPPMAEEIAEVLAPDEEQTTPTATPAPTPTPAPRAVRGTFQSADMASNYTAVVQGPVVVSADETQSYGERGTARVTHKFTDGVLRNYLKEGEYAETMEGGGIRKRISLTLDFDESGDVTNAIKMVDGVTLEVGPDEIAGTLKHTAALVDHILAQAQSGGEVTDGETTTGDNATHDAPASAPDGSPSTAAAPPAQQASAAPGPATISLTIPGSVSYLQRIAMPPDTVLETQLVEINGDETTVVAALSEAVEGQPPYRFLLEFSSTDIRPGGKYAVSAWLTAGGRNLYETPEPVVVIPDAPPASLDLLLKPAPHTP